MSDIELRLNELGKEVLDRFPEINSGGCCVYAAMIVAALAKHDVRAKGIVASWRAEVVGRSIDKARKCIQKNTITEWRRIAQSANGWR